MAYPILNTNELYSSLANQIISLQTFGDNIAGTYSEFVDAARVDGGKYGDTIVKVSTDILKSYEFGFDREGRQTEAMNLLNLDWAPDPKTQTIVLNQFRQIRVSTEAFATRRAWGTEGAFSQFNSIVLGWISDTKRVFDALYYNTFLGQAESTIGKQSLEITPIAGQNDALTASVFLADLLVELKDVSRDFTDYQFMRSFSEDKLTVIWNSKIYNQLTLADSNVVFHKDNILKNFKQKVLPAHYFAKTLTTDAIQAYNSAHAGTFNVSGDKFVILAIPEGEKFITNVEGDFIIDGVSTHLYPGQELGVGSAFVPGEAGVVDDTIAFKVIANDSIPYMSQFSVETSWVNPRSHTTNHYLTFGYNTLEYLKDRPMITVRFKENA